MSFRERLFIDQLYKDAKMNLVKIMEKRRHTFWGETPILFRVRKYKVAGEVRNQRVSVVKPQLHKLRLYSRLFKKFVPLQATPQMLRYIEACGGLDDYLLKTPDSKLHSDVASQLKVQLINLKHDLQEAANKRRLAGGGPKQAAGAQAKEAAPGLQIASSQQGAGQVNDQRQDKPAMSTMCKAQEEFAAARRERITKMLQAAAATGQQHGINTSSSSSSRQSSALQGAAWRSASPPPYNSPEYPYVRACMSLQAT